MVRRIVDAIVAMLIFFLWMGTCLAQESVLTIADSKVEPGSIAACGLVVISCRVSHSGGPALIERVAAVASFSEWNTLFPNLYDDGTNGDKVAGDGIFSLEIQVNVQSGEIKIVFNAVDKERNEIESEPIFLTVK